jgi:UDP-N-acetylmuramoyl-L-alanyl-D-glutamate--2,6-diaminopimelate ligase
MRLRHLLRDLPVQFSSLTRETSGSAPPDPEITSVTDDSRAVTAGSLFIARAGTARDGRAFVPDAIMKGAVAILADGEVAPLATGQPIAFALASPESIAHVTALVGERFHGNPTDSLRVLGVTGTNGKTTIAHLSQQFLKRAGRLTGLIGTVEIDDGRTRTPSTLTTPGSLELASLFARMVRHGCQAATMEVSSHALHQGRVAAIRFACGIFTNLTGDHLDYHKTMESYAAAKAMLFESLAPQAHAIINIDDPWAKRMRGGPARLLTCSLSDSAADCLATIETVALDSMRVTFRGPWGTLPVRLPLVGRHNAINALEAAAAVWTQGVSGDQLAAALECCEAPSGRLQPVTQANEVGGFSVLVDYAHTDDALLNVLTALRPVVPSGGVLRVVFGCGGDRDRTKRPRMAAVACQHADEVVVTSDNPRTEEPRAIVDDILKGVPASASSRVHVEVDRASAIAWAVERAKPGDIVLIAGKGHEDYQIIGTEKRQFDDRLVAQGAIASLATRRGGEGERR